MTKPWISREAADALRKVAVEAEGRLRQINPDEYESGIYKGLYTMSEALGSLTVVDAGEAEAALDTLTKYALNPALVPIRSGGASAGETIAIAEATIRHALRVAKARESGVGVLSSEDVPISAGSAGDETARPGHPAAPSPYDDRGEKPCGLRAPEEETP